MKLYAAIANSEEKFNYLIFQTKQLSLVSSHQEDTQFWERKLTGRNVKCVVCGINPLSVAKVLMKSHKNRQEITSKEQLSVSMCFHERHQ